MNHHENRAMRTDSIPVNQTFFTGEGYLIDHPILTSVGLFEYRNPDGSKRVELRLPEEVFKQESLDTYEGKPIIITHNAKMVDKENVGRESIGTILSKGYKDGDDVKAKIIIHNTDAMKDCGLKELSLGYTLDLDETPGEWNGQHYDCIQRNIAVNHLALVRKARAGDQARLNVDGKETEFEKGEKLIMSKCKRNDTIDNHTNPEVNPEGGNNGVTDGEKVKQTQNTAVTPEPVKQDAGEVTPKDLDSAMATIAEKNKEIESLRKELESLKAGEVNSDGGPGSGIKGQGDFGKPMNFKEGEFESSTDLQDALGKNGYYIAEVYDRDTEGSIIVEKDNKAYEISHHNTGQYTIVDDVREIKHYNFNDDSKSKNKDCGAPDVNPSPVRQDGKDDFRKLLKVVRIGDKLHLDGLEDLSASEAMKKVIHKIKPKMNLDGKTDEYIGACFDMIAEEVTASKTTNDQRLQMSNKVNTDAADGEEQSAMAARERMLKRRTKGV